MSELSARRDRLRRWFSLAPRLAAAHDPLGSRARQLLSRSTGLSPGGVAHALEHCLEQPPGDATLDAVCRATSESSAAHVLLSANVFTAPFRAIALALAASPRVLVRASRREPEFAKLLLEARPGTFELVDELEARAGEQVWGYGSDETLQSVAASLPAGVVFHAHGHGFGVAVIDDEGLRQQRDLAERLAWDVIAFDQRGCLSPRFALVAAPIELVRPFAARLHQALGRLEASVPRGTLTQEEATQSRRFIDTLHYVTDDVYAGAQHALAVVDAQRAWPLSPPGRHLVLVAAAEPLTILANWAGQLTQLGLACRSGLAAQLAECLPRARRCLVGRMQAPPFDGPVDPRGDPILIGDGSGD